MACLLRCCCLFILHAMPPIKILGYNFDMVLLAGTGSRRLRLSRCKDGKLSPRDLPTAGCPTSPAVRQLLWGQGSNRLGSFLLWSLLENCKEEVCLSELLTATPTSHLLLPITLLFRSSVLIRTIATHAKLYPLGSRRFLTKCLLEAHLFCFAM